MAKQNRETKVLHQWIELVNRKCGKKDRLDDIYKELKLLDTDRERFSYVSSLPEVQSVLKCLKTRIPKHEKSEETAETLRLEGNKLFQKGLYRKSLEMYNASVLTATVPGYGNTCCKAYAMTLACRSAALFHLNYHQESIGDIDSAIKYGYPVNLLYKVLDRKARCLYKMRKLYEAVQIFEEALHMLSVSALEENNRKEWSVKLKTATAQTLRMYSNNNDDDISRPPNTYEEEIRSGKNANVNKNWLKMIKCNPTYRHLSKKCNVKWNAAKGFHIIAEEDIYPGDIIIMEKPYACIPLAEYSDTHCHHCLSPLLTVTPCDSCSFVRFCSDSCKTDSCTTYHKHECLVLNALISCGVDKFGLLAIRIITKSPYHELFCAEKEYHGEVSQPLSDVHPPPQGFCSVSTLVSHRRLRDGSDIWWRTLTAIFINHILARSSYCSTTAQAVSLPMEEVTFRTGTWLLTFLQILPCNAHGVSELQLDPSVVFESTSRDIAAAIYPTLSLLNHSCDPGVTRCFSGSVVSSIAIRVIQSGEEVCDNYGAVYAIQEPAVRKEVLMPQYYFSCACEACVNDWPLCTDQSAFKPPGWRCDMCGAVLSKSSLKRNYSTGNHHPLGEQLLVYHSDSGPRPSYKPSTSSQNIGEDNPEESIQTINPKTSDAKNVESIIQTSDLEKPSSNELPAEIKECKSGKDQKDFAENSVEDKLERRRNPQQQDNQLSAPHTILECPMCSEIQTIGSKLAALRVSGAGYLRALDLLRAGDAEGALPGLLEHLRTVEETVCHPWRDLVMCQEAVKQCYSLLANCQAIMGVHS